VGRQQPSALPTSELPASCGLRTSALTALPRATELLSEPPYSATNAGRLISFDGSDTKIQIGCNIRQLPQLVNIKFSAKSRPGAAAYPANDRRVISSARPESSSVIAVGLH